MKQNNVYTFEGQRLSPIGISCRKIEYKKCPSLQIGPHGRQYPSIVQNWQYKYKLDVNRTK